MDAHHEKGVRAVMVRSTFTEAARLTRLPAVCIAAGVAGVWLTACGGGFGPAPTPVVIVVTATPAPTAVVVVITATPAPASPPAAQAPPAALKPAVAPPAASPVAATKPQPVGASPAAATGPAAASPGATPAAQQMTVGRSTSYRGLQFTVDEARSGTKIENQEAPRGKTLVGVKLRVQNPSGQAVSFMVNYLNKLLHLKLPDGSSPEAEPERPFYQLSFVPGATVPGWAYFVVDRAPPLESLALSLGRGDETQVTIPFTGPEQKVARTFEYLRSTDKVRGLLWSVSGGEIRLDIPGQQVSPGQEFIVLNVRATNPATEVVEIRDASRRLQEGPDYLRMRADNGVLLQVSAELNPLPTRFPAKAEQDTLYVWQLPRGSKNPSLVILSPDGSEHEVELGPLPPPE